MTLALVSGLLLALAFAPFGLWPLGWIAVIPLFIALEGKTAKRAFFLGWLAGMAFFLATVYWVVHSMHVYGGVALTVAVAVTLLLCAYLSLYTALFSLAVNLSGVIFAPALWVALEYLRGALFTGFPWALLGYTQPSYFMQIADIGGVWLVSFFAMAVNALLYLSIKDKKRIKYAVAAAATVLSVFLYGAVRINGVEKEIEAWEKLPVAVVQGNIGQSIKWDETMKLETIRIYGGLSRNLKAALVVWPESAMPFYLAREENLLSLVSSIPRALDSALLTGSVHYEYNENSYRFYNSAFLFDREGNIRARYDKIHLVPFGEYVPLRKVLFFVDKLTVGLGDFSSGEGPFPLPLNGEGEALGVLVCYEAIFPEIALEEVKNGATVLVNITNDGWFGKTSAPYQHLEMSAVRAVENRVYLVRAANTGVSAVITPTGRIAERTPLFKEAVFGATIGFKPAGSTVFGRGGRLFPYAMALFSAGVIILKTGRGVFVFRKRRQSCSKRKKRNFWG